jgi:tetratricopeptide (TPR) repeat protein
MARKRLNKKVALVGSACLLLLILVAVAAILHFTGDPEAFIQDGDAAWQVKDYETARRSYLKAYQLAKSDPVKIELLFKLSDLYREIDDWPKVRGCWEQIINIDTRNVRARLTRLRHLDIASDAFVKTGRSEGPVWKEIDRQATKLIEVAEQADLLKQDKAKWEHTFRNEKLGLWREEHQCLGSYLYLLRGRAEYELARAGAVTVPDEFLTKAMTDLKRVQEFGPRNVDAYWYLAQAHIEKGRLLASGGNLEAKDEAAEKAEDILKQAIQIAPDNPQAHINLLRRKLTVVREAGAENIQKRFADLEPQYLSLVDRFPSDADAFHALASFYSFYSIHSNRGEGLQRLNKSIEAVEKAIQLDKENIDYALMAANLRYRKFSFFGENEQLYKAIELASQALQLPAAQDTAGPQRRANMGNRFALCSFLARCYVEQILEPCDQRSKSQHDTWLAKAEEAVHEIEQISGSGEEPQVIKWQGILQLAKGNTQQAARQLYDAYERIKASRSQRQQRDAYLSYTLAKLFMNSSEVGAALEFVVSALDSGIELTVPQAVLEYLELLGRMNMWSHVLSPVNPYNIDALEERFGASGQSRTLRIKALIGTGQYARAQEEVSKLDPDDPNMTKLRLEALQARIKQIQRALLHRQMRDEASTILGESMAQEQKNDNETSPKMLKAELQDYGRRRAELLQRLVRDTPSLVEEELLADVCRDYIASNQIGKARDFVNQFLEYDSKNTVALLCKRLLSEPDPKNIPDQRREEIEEQVLASIDEPVQRALKLGIFYRRCGELDNAVAQFQHVLRADMPDDGKEPSYQLTEKATPHRQASEHLFSIALHRQDWELASEVVRVARKKNLDYCEGSFFAAHLAVARQQYEDALTKIEECLRQRPLFSRAHMLRSNIHAALGNEHAALDDIRRAHSLDPTDGTIAKGLANALCRRNQELGESVSSDQMIEARRALERAVSLNPGDLALQGQFAEFISSEEPLMALAILQSLQHRAPTFRNAVLLGMLATQMAADESNQQRKETLFGIAGASFEQARNMEPHNTMMLESYAEYHRAMGQEEKARQLLVQANNEQLLWRHYFELGRFDEAKQVLQRLHERKPRDHSVVRGLFLVAERTSDANDIQKFSEELLSIQDTVENRLDQIRAYLKVGLIKQAEHKLQSFREKYPDESQVLLLEGWLAMRQGQLKKALRLTNQNLETDQENAPAWRLRGQIYLLMADYSQAIIDLKRSKSLSDSVETRITLAKAYLQSGREQEAITELKSTVDKPDAPLQARVLLERVYSALGRKSALKEFYDQTLEKFPDSAFWLNRAAAFAISERQFDAAKQLFEKAYTLKREEYAQRGLESAVQDMQYAMAFDGYLQALILGAGNRESPNSWRPEKLDKVFQESKTHLDTALAPLAFHRMAEAKHKLGDKEAATDYCRKAVDRAGTNERLASEILLRMFLLLGDEEVSAFCREKLQENPNSLAANFTMFNLSKMKRQYNKAVGYIEKCIELVGPDSPRGIHYTVKKAELLTLAYTKTSDNTYVQKAIKDYESLLAKEPNNTRVLNNLAYMLAENNERIPQALKYAKQALEHMPNNPSFLDTYAYVLYKSDKKAEAAEFMTAALQQYQQNELMAPSEVYEHLGMIKEDLGRSQQALDAYKQALQVGADKLPEAVKERISSAIERLSK